MLSNCCQPGKFLGLRIPGGLDSVGAGGRTRTGDLLITSCSRRFALHLPSFCYILLSSRASRLPGLLFSLYVLPVCSTSPSLFEFYCSKTAVLPNILSEFFAFSLKAGVLFTTRKPHLWLKLSSWPNARLPAMVVPQPLLVVLALRPAEAPICPRGVKEPPTVAVFAPAELMAFRQVHPQA